VKGCGRLDLRLCKSGRLRIRIRIEDRHRCSSVARPKTEAAHFLGVRFSRDCVRQMRDPAGMRRRRPSGKPRHRQIETPPEDTRPTALATKTRTELLKHEVALDKNAPKSIGIFAVVSAMLLIFVEGDRILDLVRHFVDRYRQMKLVETLHHGPVKIRNGTRFQFNRPPLAIAFEDAQLVIDKIKSYLKRRRTMRDR